MGVFDQLAVVNSRETVERAQAVDQFGSLVKAIRARRPRANPAAMRKVVRRAERTSRPAVCKRV